MRDRDWHPETRASRRSSCSALVLPAVYGGWCSGPSGHRSRVWNANASSPATLSPVVAHSEGTAMPELTAERVRELLDYDQETGRFTRRRSQGRGAKGQVPGSRHQHGYIVIRIDRKAYLAHRLAWLVAYGEWPKEEIDHINGVRDDNRITNLRDVSRRTNRENARVPRSTNRVGLLGVCWDTRDRKFLSTITTEGRNISLGYFTDPIKAHEAYLEAKRRLHKGCTI